MDRMLARWQVLQIEFDPDSFARLGYRSSAHRLTTSILQLNRMSGVLRDHIRQQAANYDSSHNPCNKVFPDHFSLL
jgi:hypothetical protein